MASAGRDGTNRPAPSDAVQRARVAGARSLGPAPAPGRLRRGHFGAERIVEFQKGNELIAPDIERHVAKVSAFLDVYRVGDDRFETQNAFVKLAGLVEVERRETDVGKSSVG